MQRTSQACEPCKRRKVRCNGQPQCQQCTHSGIPCTYPEAVARRSRKDTVGRGRIIASLKEIERSSERTNLVLAPKPNVESAISSFLNPAFFLGQLDEYDRFVYPMSPVVKAVEIRNMIHQMDTNREIASFVYVFSAVTLNLTCHEPIQRGSETSEQIATLLTRSLELRSPIGFNSKPSVVTLMRSLFTQMCFIGLRKLDLGFLYLREAISLIYMLRIHEKETMQELQVEERCRRQRAYYECYIHERFTALTYYRPPCLPPLPALPDRDPSIDRELEEGYNKTIKNFSLVDSEFLGFWLGDRTAVTPEWVAKKQQELDNLEWIEEVSQLPVIWQADLMITRHWLRTLTWQIALSNILLSSSARPSMLLSLSFPLQLSNQLRQFLTTIPRESVGIHGSGLLEKLFEIANTITDVVLHLSHALGDNAAQYIRDILFLKHYVFSFPGFADLEPISLNQKFEMIRDKYPEIKDIELLV